MSEFEIEVREPGKAPRRLPLRAGLGLGRHPDNALVVEDPKVSAFHARIDAVGEGFVLVDIGSSNGTHIIEGPSLQRDEGHPIRPGLRFMTGFTEYEFFASAPRRPAVEPTRMMPLPMASTPEPAPTPAPAPKTQPEVIPVSTDLPPIPAGDPEPPRSRRPLDVASKGVMKSPNSELSPIAEPESDSVDFPVVDFDETPPPPKKRSAAASAPSPKARSPKAEPEATADLSEQKTVGHPRVVFDDFDSGPGPDPDEATILSPPSRGGPAAADQKARAAFQSDAATIRTPMPTGIGRAVQDDDATWISPPAGAAGNLPKADEGLGFMKPRLIIATEEQRAVELIASREFTIGRRSSSGPSDVDCALESAAVSSRHAAIVFRQGRFFLEDRGSRNGTMVGGKKLDSMASRELHSDDHIVFGMADALFVVDRDHQLRELPRAPYRDALDHLVRKKKIRRDHADLLWQRCAVDGEHPAESLLQAGDISVRQWCEALDSVGGTSGFAAAPRRSIQWLLIVITLLLLGAIAVLVIKFR